LIDWWIMTRDTVLFLLYLSVMAYLLYGNKIDKKKAIILMVTYIVHIILMKFSAKYEVIIKHNLANAMEIGELKKIAKEDISTFHRTLRTEAISIEMLNKINFKFIDGYIVFEESKIKRKMTPINIIKLGEE